MLVVAMLKNKIADVLDEQGVSAYKLSQILGKHNQYVYRLVNAPTLDHRDLITMDEIARALNVPITDLYERVD